MELKAEVHLLSQVTSLFQVSYYFDWCTEIFCWFSSF